MTDQNPITPPLELVQQWTDEIYGGPGVVAASDDICLAKLAAQWGADQELEACCEWLVSERWFKYEPEAMEFVVEDLRAVRRPKPPSLKEQALQELDKVDMLWATEEFGKDTLNSLETIRKALEALPND